MDHAALIQVLESIATRGAAISALLLHSVFILSQGLQRVGCQTGGGRPGCIECLLYPVGAKSVYALKVLRAHCHSHLFMLPAVRQLAKMGFAFIRSKSLHAFLRHRIRRME